jgi:hypothetical protein
MPTIPATDDMPLIRTDFSDEPAWRELARAALAESGHGFRANLFIVDDRAFEGASAEQLSQSVGEGPHHACLFVADAIAIGHKEHPLLCVDLRSARQSFRVVPSELWGVENNLAIANMDFEEFAGAVDQDGVFRGF